MPKFIQQVTGKSYATIEPRLDWACGKISLLDDAVKKLQNIVPPVIASTDKYIDITVDAVVNRAVAVRSSYIDTTVDAVVTKATAVKTQVATHVVPVVEPIQTKIIEVQGILAVKGLVLVESSEQLLDRFLPVPEQYEKEKTEEDTALVSRIARLPVVVPLRVTMTLYVKANGVVEAITLSGFRLVGIVLEKQNFFVQHVLERSKPLVDRVSALTAPALERVRAGSDSALAKLQDSKQAVTVQVNGIVIRLRLTEAKAWSLEKADVVKDNTLPIVMAAVRVAHETTVRVIGQERATFIFTKLYLPLQDQVVKGVKDDVKEVLEVKTKHE